MVLGLTLLTAFFQVLAGCATPAERIDRLATSSGFDRRVVAGDGFEHLVYVKTSGRPEDGFRVYLEGDGTPWITPRRVAEDPTPRRPLALRLMALDPGPALYLGRPCYFDLSRNCRPAYWTGARYSGAVVDSMVAALRTARRELGWGGKVTLVGYSGGGTLAMLMAPRVKDVATVVTLAANLDVAGWARLHGYSPLSESLDPADQSPLPARVRQVHLVGGEDRNVPPRITRDFAERQRGAEVVEYPRYDHHCCWEEVWRSVLDRL